MTKESNITMNLSAETQKGKSIEQEEPWIEAEGLSQGGNSVDRDEMEQPNNGEGGELEQPDMGDLFADPDPYEEFVFEFPDHIRIALSGIKAENGQTLNSTGLTLWRASPQLCNFMITTPASFKGKMVIELGAGLGLCGLLAHFLGSKSVVLTDGDTDTLAAMRANVASNVSSSDNSSVTCRQLRWGRNVESFLSSYSHGFDVILASDVIYVEEVVDPLFDTVLQLMRCSDGTRGEFWLSYARRNVSIDLVLECARRRGLEWKEPSGAEGVFVFSQRQDSYSS